MQNLKAISWNVNGMNSAKKKKKSKNLNPKKICRQKRRYIAVEINYQNKKL